MSFVLPSSELLSAYAQCDAFPTPSNQYMLYTTILLMKPDLESIQLALRKLLLMHENNTIPQKHSIEVFYFLAYGYYLQREWNRAVFYCEKVLERKRLHKDASNLLEHVKRERQAVDIASTPLNNKARSLKAFSLLSTNATVASTPHSLLSASLQQMPPTINANLPLPSPKAGVSSANSTDGISLPDADSLASPPPSMTITPTTDEEYMPTSNSFDDVMSESSFLHDSQGASPPNSDLNISSKCLTTSPTLSLSTTITVESNSQNLDATLSASSPVQIPVPRIRTKTWIFGKLSSSSSKTSPMTAENHERLLLIQFFTKNGIERLKDAEKKQYSQIFNTLSNSKSTDTDALLDEKSFTHAFGVLFRDSTDVIRLHSDFFFRGFCRFIDSFVRDNYAEISASSKNKKNRTPLPSTPLSSSYTVNGLTKQQFLFILSIMLHGSTEEKLSLSFQCFNQSAEGFIHKDDVTDVVRDVCHILSSFNIALGSPSSVAQLFWQILTAGVTNEVPDTLTHQQFLSNGEKHFFKLAGLGLVIANPFTPTPTVRGVKTIPGDREWDHVIDVMTGFRISAQMISGAFLEGREPSLEDFDVKLKFSLPRRGQNAVAQFTSYAPHVFGRIRELCGISDSEFFFSLGLESLLGRMMLGDMASLTQLGSDGRSGASFLYSSDGRYVIKNIPTSELKAFLNSLPDYYSHIQSCPDSLLCRYLACAQLNTSCFVIMKNIFMTTGPMDEIFDLKGSIIARSNPKGPVKKDNDLNYEFDLGQDRAEKLKVIVKRDAKHLEQLRFTDYSLLVGVQNQSFEIQGATQDHSGAPLFDENNGMISRDGKRKFFMGVIDTFTTYNFQKRVEKNLKIIGHAARSDTISSQSADIFASRFCERVVDRLIV
eukprot:CAMPEP_0117438196 /NCGR_PEP_ID=MMETSP0759-20121206/1928_1 /TAXON_ID=63605 /ORGANISM="Percolomonas cosmopolitus, Strain WS" /LENGTH=883 /DNA_ID=CAMNT_0005229879 /DNA_START=103 /DNA_END=2754 /DNA_ORIENTATION=-